MVEGNSNNIIHFTASIVAAYVAKNAISLSEIPALMTTVHAAVAKLSANATEPEPSDALKPAVPIKKSVSDTYIVCLEDGRKFKSLKRHLRVHYNMTPEQYRLKWRLPSDYPMVAPGYAEIRSRMAKDMGLGRRSGGGNGKKPT